MGAIWFSRAIEFVSAVSETVGYKSGLALTREEIMEKLETNHFVDYFTAPDEQMIRIRSEEFEAVIAELLYRLGNIDSPNLSFPGAELFHKYKNNPKKLPIVFDIQKGLPDFLSKATDRAIKDSSKLIDPTPFVKKTKKKHGVTGALIALDLLKEVNAYFQRNPWSQIRLVEWKDIVDLKSLFNNESMTTFYGKFFDQRFIDYLFHNFDEIDKINWRKFEGLAAEYFSRAGFFVEVGPGRKDEGIDIRLWPQEEYKQLPPTILVQCKRTKNKVSKVVVKALWADIIAEESNAGLIVTTTALSPGAEKICKARDYPISQANRNTVKKWVEAMRTPNTGIFLGE